MKKERVDFQGRINVGTFKGSRVLVEATIKLKAGERKTTTHKTVPVYQTLSISGDYNGGCGQIIDTLKKLDTVAIPKKDLIDLIDIWEHWHLNDMKAGCEHQDTVNYNDPEREFLLWAEHRKCPHGYKYGTAWLVEELPQEVIDRLTEIFTTQPQAKSVVEEWELTLNGNHGELTAEDTYITVAYVQKTTQRKAFGTTDKFADKNIYQYHVTCINKESNETAGFDFYDSINNAKKATFANDLGYSIMCNIRMNYFTTSTNYPTFESFCFEFGYDSDSRQAKKTYKTCIELGDKLNRVFDDELIETLPQ